MLESDTGLHALPDDQPLPQSELMSIIRDFFRTEIRKEMFSPVQIDRYLKQDPEQKKLLKTIQSDHQLISSLPFRDLSERFKEAMKKLKDAHSLSADKLIEDFRKQAPAYSNYSKETKEETLEKVCRFAHLFDHSSWSDENFDQLITDNLVWTKALDPALIKKKHPDPNELHYPRLTEDLVAILDPLVEEARRFFPFIGPLGKRLQEAFSPLSTGGREMSPDDVLRKMKEAIQRPLFLSKVRSHYQAVIVDEFQDTDPLQWEIFNTLFLPEDKSWKGNIYLVGDPKQSIYSFRQADIYTYLSAAKAIGEENCLSLDVNYRSQANLVQGLNLLFSNE